MLLSLSNRPGTGPSSTTLAAPLGFQRAGFCRHKGQDRRIRGRRLTPARPSGQIRPSFNSPDPMPDLPPITFERLSATHKPALMVQMRDPRVTRHLPLLTEPWSDALCDHFLSAKDACWERDGLGHWAIFQGGDYVGWGGFQREGADWDFGLVLTPDAFGFGIRITRQALEFARQDPRIACVTFLLPRSRTGANLLRRLGAREVGETDHEGQRFTRYLLETG